MNAPENILTVAEQAKRGDLQARKPYIAAKLANISAMEARGEVSPIIRLEKSYLCNFQCTHCSAEYYMDRHLKNVLKVADTRSKMTLNDIRRLSREADDLGLARFVITGGEPLVMKDFDEVVAAIDPDKHYIITDTNGWFLDEQRAKHIKSIGVEKVQLSLDSFIEKDHDAFRSKPGSYKRVMKAIDASLDAGLNLILSTVLVRGRASSAEFHELCRFVTERGIGLYVSYAKPTGACSLKPELVIGKEDADILRELEKQYNVFTHMTPSYGSFKGCITVKGIITVTSTMEVTPCPYIDMSLGNLRETTLKAILARGMGNPWLGPHRPDCLIGEDPQFIQLHREKTSDVPLLPVPWGKGFSDEDTLPNQSETAALESTSHAEASQLFNVSGRPSIKGIRGLVEYSDRGYFAIGKRSPQHANIHARTIAQLGDQGAPSVAEFSERLEAIRRNLENDAALANILRGACIPFMLPKATVQDVGHALDTVYLPAVRRAFEVDQPSYRFTNHVKRNLAGLCSIAPGSRHERLIESMADQWVVGLYVPCLGGYSIRAARELVGHLPDHLLLAGGFDTCAALIGTPDLLTRKDGYPPLLWLSALDFEFPGKACQFEAYGYNLTFNQRNHFDHAAEYWTSAVVALG